MYISINLILSLHFFIFMQNLVIFFKLLKKYPMSYIAHGQCFCKLNFN
nr:MAG TPA: hypothetical protein [Caudoviricetes sp.]